MDIQSMVMDAVKSALDSGGSESKVGKVGKAAKAMSPNGKGSSDNGGSSKGGSPFSGTTGLALGAGAAALAPMAAKKLGQRLGVENVGDLLKSPMESLEGLGQKAGGAVGDKVSDKVDQAGGPGGMIGDTVKNVLPFGGGADSDDDDDDDGDGKKGGKGKTATGYGQGRRIMVQQVQYIPVNIKDVYRAWTESEWPQFMHRVNTLDRQIEEDSARYAIGVKGLWFKKNFTAQVQEQVPFKFMTWDTVQGNIKNTGRVSFHAEGDDLTLMLLNLDMAPSGLREKWVRGFRYHKRGIRSDFHRFAAWVQMRTQDELDDLEGWLGTVEGGTVTQSHEEYVEEHPEEQDRGAPEDEDQEDPEDQEDQEDEEDQEGEEDQEDEDEEEEEPEDSADEDEDEEEEEPEDSADEDEDEDEEQPRGGRSRTRASKGGRGRSGSSSRRSSPDHASRRRSASRRS